MLGDSAQLGRLLLGGLGRPRLSAGRQAVGGSTLLATRKSGKSATAGNASTPTQARRPSNVRFVRQVER